MTIEMPDRISALPRFGLLPVPWFVTNFPDGKPDFRVVDGSRMIEAIKRQVCWVCGQALGRFLSFAIGPMCTINRVSGEPPQHRECSIYSAQVCPFLLDVDRKRRPGGLVDVAIHDECMIARNPGVTAVWVTRSCVIIKSIRGYPLWRIGDPAEKVLWFREGRSATRAEVEASIAGGLPALERMAQEDGGGAPQELARMRDVADRYLPMT